MRERLEEESVQISESCRSKTFHLVLTSQGVDIGNGSEGRHPILRVPVMTGDERCFGNFLKFTVMSACPISKSADLTFTQLADCAGAHLDEIKLENGVINIGRIGKVALRDVNHKSRLQLRICLDRNVQLHSPEHSQMVNAS